MFSRQRARPWRLLTLGSGLLLAACFFLPAVQSCNAPVIPAEDVWKTVVAELIDPHRTSGFDPWTLVAFPMYVAAYLFGLLAAVAAVAQLVGSPRLTRSCSMLMAGWIALNCVLVLSWAGTELRYQPGDWATWLFFVFIPFLALVYGALTFRRTAVCAFHCRLFLPSLCAFVWFGYFVGESALHGGGLYGLYLSFAASCGLLLGAIGQAKALTRAGWLRTIGRLLTCRLTEPPWEPRCPNCDYLLIGLPQPRCPECGRPFTPAEAAPMPLLAQMTSGSN